MDVIYRCGRSSAALIRAIVLAALALLLVAAALPPAASGISTGASNITPPPSPAGVMETRDFPMPLSTLVRLIGDHPDKAASSSQINDDFKNFFAKAGIDWPAGTRLAFDGNKTLWVTNTPRNLDHLANLLQGYSDNWQVEISATFVDFIDGQDKSTSASPALFGPNSSNATLLAALKQAAQRRPAPPSGSASSRPSAALGAFNPPMEEAVLRAFKHMTGANIVASPKVTVLSGKEGVISITQGTTQPPNGNYSADPVGIELKVLPTVEDDQSISFSVKARLSQIISENPAVGGVVQQTNVTELVASGWVANAQTSVFDLGFTLGPPVQRRLAFVTFTLINPDGTRVPPPAKAAFQTSSSTAQASSAPPAPTP